MSILRTASGRVLLPLPVSFKPLVNSLVKHLPSFINQDNTMVEKDSKSNLHAITDVNECSQSFSLCTQKPEQSRSSPGKKIFLPYGVGPIIDCEIDDESEEPDYLSYTLVPSVNLVEDTSIPSDEVP